MRVATFNINNTNKRLDNLLAWLAKAVLRTREFEGHSRERLPAPP